MKEMCRIIILVALSFVCNNIRAAKDFEIDGLYYGIISMQDKTVEVSGSSTGITSVVIPETVSFRNIEFRVIGIGPSTFANQENLVNVVMPNSIEYIGESSFEKCKKLTDIHFPHNLRVVADYAFSFSGITGELRLPNSVDSIGRGAFNECGSLTSLSLENTQVNTLGSFSFYACTKVKSINLPSSLKVIGDGAFAVCFIKETGTEYYSLRIPDSVTTIGSDALSSTGLDIIYFPKELRELGNNALLGSTSLKEIDLTNCDKLETIGKQAFFAVLCEVQLPNSVKTIGAEAFSYSDITKLTLPNSLKSIREKLFAGCKKLEYVYVPSSVTSCASDAFSDCINLKTIDVPKLGRFLGIKGFPQKLVKNVKLNGEELAENLEVEIEEGQDYVYSYLSGSDAIGSISCFSKYVTFDKSAFKNCKNLKTLTFDGDMIGGWIYEQAFFGCENLKTITFPSKLHLGKSAFGDCKSLEVLKLPYECSIGSNAFQSCTNLKSVTMPVTSSEVASAAFADCSNIEEVIATSRDPYNISPSAFNTVVLNFSTLRVPWDMVEWYKLVEGWKDFYNIEKLPHDNNDVPVELTADSYTIEYGDTIPNFTFKRVGSMLDGEPEIACDAHLGSSVGVYNIVISKGSLQNYNDTYVNGTLTITKAPLTVSVGNYTREYGIDNPDFELKYEGWKLNEDVNVLIKEPWAVCKAMQDSEPGEYPITLEGGEAQNYEFKFINGLLTITEASGVVELQSNTETFDVYTINGVRIRRQVTSLQGLPSGVYVVNKKVVLVK